ncbi:MAG: DUF423 domain-containing protein [Cyanobacteria bacterium P01_H01_bin.15]
MSAFFMTMAAIFGGLSVAAGAFASHALRSQLSERALEIFATGTQYQMYHALGLLLVALLLLSDPLVGNGALQAAGYAFITGTFLFSGSLYALSVTGIRWLGAITPIGGVAFLVGWICLLLAASSLRT